MGRFAKKITKDSKSSSDSFIHKSAKKAIAIDKETTSRAIAFFPSINRQVTLITMIKLSYFMHKVYGFGGKRFKRLNDKIQFVSNCLDDKLVEYDELRVNVIMGTDHSYCPIRWTDYKYNTKHAHNSALEKDTSDLTMMQIKDCILTQKKRDRAEEIFAALEIIIIVALHDYFKWGKKRLKKLIGMLERARNYSREEFKKVLDYLAKHKQTDFSKADREDFIKMNAALEAYY